MAEGIPGGSASSESIPPKTQVPCNRPIDIFFKPIHSNSNLFFSFVPTDSDGAAQKDNCLEMSDNHLPTNI